MATRTKLKNIIRSFCLDCMQGSYQSVDECNSKVCKIIPYNVKLPKVPKKSILLKTIHDHCLDCVGSYAELKDCQGEECGFYTYRFGIDPIKSRLPSKGFKKRIPEIV